MHPRHAGRTDLLLLASGLGAIRLLQKKQESLLGAFRLLRWPAALFLVFFVGLIFTNKNTGATTGGVTNIAIYYVLTYIAGPLAAFDSVVQHPADFMISASHTFQFPLRLAAALHLINYTKPPVLDRFVFVPFPTNVYTVFKFYFLEFGTIGAVVLLFLVGLLHSLLYLKARQGGRFCTFLFAYSMYPVLMVIFDEVYISSVGACRALSLSECFTSSLARCRSACCRRVSRGISPRKRSRKARHAMTLDH